jgi:pilus assembly protein Flp/PilA
LRERGLSVEVSANKPRDKSHTRLKKLLRAKGQGLVEYALILVMIAIVIIAILTFIGQQVFNNLYSKISSGFPESP